MRPAPLLSVVVPTRNEAANVELVVARVLAALGEVPVEICFVDDSDDETVAVLEGLEQRHPGQVRCLFRSGADRAGGLSTAVVAGLRLAAGRYVCVMDADLQHPPETIPRMLDAAQEGADLVVASRYVPGGSHGGLDGAVRRLVSRGATQVARALFVEARQSRDPLSGFFLCRRALIDGIEFRPVGFKILLELLVCVPGMVVRDVPLEFAARAHGDSKASMGQGLLYLRHLRSLFLDVKGSARGWKFAAVGGSGLLLFLTALALLSGAGLSPLQAFLPAFALSLGWNTVLHRVWTFADLRRCRGGEAPWMYLRWAVASGVVMLGAYLLLVGVGLRVVAAGAAAAVLGMATNAVSNRAAVRRRPLLWSGVAVDVAVQTALARLATQIGADRCYVLPASARLADGGVPGELVDRVVERRRPALWTEAPSHRPQRRTNIEAVSTLLLPAVEDGRVLGVVVCERRAPRGFEPDALEAATAAVDSLTAVLAGL